MKKKLSILVTFAIMLTLLTGCAIGGEKKEYKDLDAKYQLKSIFEFDFWADEFNINSAPNVAIEEDDERIAMAYTYEDFIACFEPVKIDSSNVLDYFYGLAPSANNKVTMSISRPNHYIAEDVEFSFTLANGETKNCVYKAWSFGALCSYTDGEEALWTDETINTIKVSKEFYLYKFNPAAVKANKYDELDRYFVKSKAQNPYGEYTLIEEYGVDDTEQLCILLHRMKECGLINEDGSFKVPETPDTGAPEDTQTPDTGDTEETPKPDPEPTWSQPFMGKYFVGDEVYADSSKIGVYMDETYLYVKSDSFGVVEPVALIYEERAEGVYFISEYYEDGYYYYVETGELKRMNSYDGSTLATLYVSDKATYEAIGN